MSTDEKCCPLCGEKNGCELVAGQNTCWCMRESFPEGIFEAVTEEPHKCICQTCLNTYKGV
ncbi:cysteine-rich CWC family protein [Lysinibacillus parviboronicapiens]|uniref:cysteine-rich CWC family protein n=1 Tax=Lysinibacillus parviboronicapiens TaxID=436516 RepID=UPI000D38AA06|nr:cysteine-rich CWC family protein [Lysinibacillus parviboronicapiens]